MEVAVLVFAGVLLGGAWSAPTYDLAKPELILQPLIQGPVVGVPVTYVSRHHAQDELGQVNYGFSYPGQDRNELRNTSGNVAGAYTYIDADNKVVRVKYTAGEGGFQVKSNNLPVGVTDTPVVLAAKLQFVEAYNAAALTAAAAADDAPGDNVQSTDVEATNKAIPVRVKLSPVRDTPEVIAAKLQFVEAYNAAALAAANAPDDPVDYAAAHVQLKTATVLNPNPVRDTPEVTAAKLQFVEAYNAAALAAANAADSPQEDGSSKVPVVQDTPEVTAAKLQFVEAYNAAAITAALAPDDGEADNALQEDTTEDLVFVTDKPSEVLEPVVDNVDVRVINSKEETTTIIPPKYHEEEEDVQTTTLFPINVQAQNEVRNVYELVPTKVESPTFENKQSISPVIVPQVIQPPVQPTYVETPVVQPPVQPTYVETPVVQPPVQPTYVDTPVVLPPAQPVTILQPDVQDPAVAMSVTYESHHHVQDELGQVNYGFSYPGQAKNELRDASGNVAGVYTYIDAEDRVIRVEYTAGEGGFQVKSNNLLEAARDTPEVLAAKLQFVEAYNAAALAAAAAAPDDDDGSRLETVEGLVSNLKVFVAPNPVEDTPEVIAPDDVDQNKSADEATEQVTTFFPVEVKEAPEIQYVEVSPEIHLPTIISEYSQVVENEILVPTLQVRNPVPQAHAYNVVPPAPVHLSPVEAPTVLTRLLRSSTFEAPANGPSAPVSHVSRYHTQDELGQVNYGFSYPGHAKNETRDASGNVAGVYTYTDPDDKLHRVEYTAGQDGFQVKSNNLPVGVRETPEVLAATQQFVDLFNNASLAAAIASTDPEPDNPNVKVVVFLVLGLGPQDEETPDHVEDSNTLQVDTSEEPSTEMPEEQEAITTQPLIYDIRQLRGVSPSAGTAVLNVVPQPQHKTAYDAAAAVPETAPRYSGYLSGLHGALYTNSFPYGIYGFHSPITGPISLPQETPVNKVAYTTYILHVPLPYQIPGNPNPVIMYAPSYTHHG